MTASAFIVQREWLRDDASRLDATPFSAGGAHILERLRTIALKTTPLGAVANVFAVSLRQRQFVRDPARGVRFLASADMALIDPPHDFYLSHARTSRLDAYVVHPDWTLISSTGTVGNVTYVRDEIAGSAVSQDVLRVQAEGALAPGYLFAFLATTAARSLIALKAYGTTVDRIHPDQLLELPVPIPAASEQERIHELVRRAGKARTEAARLLNEVANYFDSLCEPMPSNHDYARSLGIVRRRSLRTRLDAFHHIGWAVEAKASEGEYVGSLARVFRADRVVRLYTELGVPFLSGIDVYRARPVVRVVVPARIIDSADARVESGDLLVQASGQRYGLLGRAAYVGNRLHGWAASDDLIRIKASSSEARARIFAFFRSESGRRRVLRHSYGTSIPHVNGAGISAISVPTLSSELTERAMHALELRENADRDEGQAIAEVEQWLA